MVDYEKSNIEQQKLIKEIYSSKTAGKIIFCTHEALVTTGRATKESDIFGWQGPVLESPRGGRATYHGPNQLVIYPLVNLSFTNFSIFKKRDVTNYLRLLEQVVIASLTHFNIEAYQRCEKIDVNGEQLEATGVWVAGKKIASIGIAVRRWVTYHGIAINIFKDETAFKGINPCGFSSNIMTSMEDIIGSSLNQAELKSVFLLEFNKLFK